MTAVNPPALSDFIIAAFEEACPEVDGHAVYMRGFDRFTKYCEDQHRKANKLPERKREIIGQLLEQRPPLSDQAITRMAGVAPSAIGKRRPRPRG